jgi:hypothetical protein
MLTLKLRSLFQIPSTNSQFGAFSVVKARTMENLLYFMEYSAHFFCIENYAEIFPAHYTWKVAEEGFKMASMMNKLAMINSCEIILEK